ncbi:hypothetical protein J4462_01690 [Candidatus Pacearchaeota archaeon]|nr:hypothetical protein [Candidatus Pacearchaeota archaeon]
MIAAEEIEDVEIDFSPEETVENQEEQETENSERENEIEEREEEPRESQEPFPEPEIKQEELTTGNVIFSFFRTLAGKMKLTGFAVEEGSDSSGGDNSGSSESNSDSGESNPPNENIGEDNNEEPPPQETESPIFNDNPQEIPRDDFQGERDDREEDREDREGEDKERRENECGERCDRECYDMEIRPCSEDCIWKECGQELECNVDDVRTSCENKCKEENNLDSCKDECSEKCLSGENTWKEPEREEHKQEKFVFTLGGSCREAQGKTEGFIWFGGWGENFQDFHLVKNKYYSRGGTDWCADDLENLLKQRRELEKSFNEEFAKWFFEKYVANSAEDWENHISGIFELYWRDVDLSKQIAERYRCLRKTGLPEHNLINFKYETEYGSVEFWEEIKTTKLMDENSEDVEIISPYMKLWLFPSRDFFKAEMKRSMESHELPGDSDEEKGITEEEKNNLREDEEFMDQIRDFNENFGEDFVLQIKDFETDEIIFNVHMKINEEELIYFEPMPSDENPAENVKIELDSEKLLDIIEFQESDRVELESPPWDKQPRTGAVKGVVDGVQMYFKFRSLMNSAKVTPKDAEDNAIFFTRAFFEKVMGGEREEGPDMEGPGGCQNEEECEEYCSQPENREECSQFRDREEFPDSENREFLTGEVVRN